MARIVLVVEDTDHVAALEIALSALNGIDVVVLRNGRQALRLIRSSCCDLAAVITDLHLPYVDGFELVRAIRAEVRYTRLPLVVISGDTEPDIAALVRSLGADAFFSKPYSPTAIRNSLEDLLNVK